MGRSEESAAGLPSVFNGNASVEFRVRYAECDQARVAHHATYPIWFEMARTEFCRDRGIDYGEMERCGFFLPLVELKIRYVAAARYDDLLTVETWVEDLRRRTIRMKYRLMRGAALVAEAETYQVLVNGEGKPCSWPLNMETRFKPTNAAAPEPPSPSCTA